MTPRPPGRRQPCTAEAARARLHDAQAFLEAAETSADPDVKATNAIHAAIAAATCVRQATILVDAARSRALRD